MARFVWGTSTKTWSDLRPGLRARFEPVLADMCREFELAPGLICIRSNVLLEQQRAFDDMRLTITTTRAESGTSPGLLSRGGGRIQIALESGDGDQLMGAVVFAADYAYQLEDLLRALLASTAKRDALNAGRVAILSSDQPNVSNGGRLQISAMAAGHKPGVFHCENSVCPGRNAIYVIPLGVHDLDPSRPGAKAYPCLQCPDPKHVWALTFDRFATQADLARTDYFVLTYLHEPDSRRLTAQAGPMSVVASQPGIDWLDTWNPHAIPPVPESIQSMHAWAEVQRTFELLSADSSFARWIPSTLSVENLHALVSYARQLPSEAKSEQYVEGMALAFDPRQQKRFENSADEDPGALEESYPYIALPPARFRRVLADLDVLDLPGSFLDVGCGIGDKLFLAYTLGQFTEIEGVEYNVQNVGVANYLIRGLSPRPATYPISLTQHDALAFERYGDFDVIYMYRPFRTLEKMQALFSLIAAQMKPGAVLVDGFAETSAITKTEAGYACRDYTRRCWQEPGESVELEYPDGVITVSS